MFRLAATASLLFTLTACTTVPSNVPDLLTKTADQVENQAAWTTSEWESSIASNSGAMKLLDLIHPVITSIDQSRLDTDSQGKITKFLQGYTAVRQRLESAISQQSGPGIAKSNFEKLSTSIRFANNYIEKSIDEKKRVEAAIEGVTTIRNTIINDRKNQ